MTQKYVGYYRVSTKKQGKSGLGLKSQKSQIHQFIENHQGELIGEFTEVDSGKKKDRTELAAALKLAKETSSTLIIAKLDRLARDVEFIFSLKNSGVSFKALDVPEFNTLTVGIFATMAQYERERISERTKSALKVKKEQGFKLGSPQNLTKKSREISLQVRKQKAKIHAQKICGTIADLRSSGKTYREIALRLNECGLKTSRGKDFQPMSVKRIFDMLVDT